MVIIDPLQEEQDQAEGRITAQLCCDWYNMSQDFDLRIALQQANDEELLELCADGGEQPIGFDALCAEAIKEEEEGKGYGSAIIAYCEHHPEAYYEVKLPEDRTHIRIWVREHRPGLLSPL